MTDALEATFQELLSSLAHPDRLSDTHSSSFYTFVHNPADTRELHRRIPMWTGILERTGFAVNVLSLGKLAWDVVDRSQRWDDWLETEEPGAYQETNVSMRDVLLREDDVASGLATARPGLMTSLAPHLLDETPGRLVLLTDAALLHPWLRVDKLGSSLHSQIRCPTVLFYPGRRRGPFSLHFLGFHPEDAGSRRTTILGGL